jgi:crotonobetainyl-CoA:carnitine CoA-transferase CaiB-like acyl-CoA transferase
MARLGLDYASLAGRNPRLIYCSISGYGQEGEGSERPAYAPIVHAASGFDLANLAYQEGLDRPPATGIFMADILAGTNAFGAIQAALFRRERTGEGERIEVTLLASMLNLLVYECQEAQFPAETRRPVYQPLRALDGFVIVAPVSQNNFEAVCGVIGRPELRSDPRFAGGQAREQHWEAMMALIEDWTCERDGAECEATMLAAGVPCSRYRSVAEALQDPAMQRGGLARVQDSAGAFQVPNPPFRFSGSRAEVSPRLAGKGEDAAAVLDELLGIDPGPLFAAGALKR